jgi:hypothetical protein
MMDFRWMQIYLRDGYHCPLSDLPFEKQGDMSAVVPHCAHILPFSLNDKVRYCPIVYHWEI